MSTATQVLLPEPRILVALPVPKAKDVASISMKEILRDLAHLFVYGGTTEEYVERYYKTPARKKKLRRAILLRIHRQAIEENWNLKKMGLYEKIPDIKQIWINAMMASK